jgi:DNA anti-recombination protein RmuC
MDRIAWTDERLDERMSAIDQTFERLHDDLGGIRDEIRGLRGDFSSLQDRLVQIGFGLVGVLITALVALIIALA